MWEVRSPQAVPNSPQSKEDGDPGVWTPKLIYPLWGAWTNPH